MTNQEKAQVYDNLIRESDHLQRINSKLKSEYVTNIPMAIQLQIDTNNKRIADLVLELERLMN